MFKGYFDGILVNIDDLVSIDGCNIFQCLWYIILLIGVFGIMVVGFFLFVVLWGDYLIVFIIS